MTCPTRGRLVFELFVVLALSLLSFAQHRPDPLNPLEIDQLRDAMLDPDERLKLYVKFARNRLTTMEQMRANPKTSNRGLQTHDLLQDFLTIYEELDDNIDMYVGRKNDIRRPMKLVIEADTEFQSKLRALKNATNAEPKEATQYEFLLSDSLETVDSSSEDHRKTLAQVEEYMKHKKKN